MIQLQNLTLRQGPHLLFKNATLQIHPKWKVGLTGANGAGKSSLFSALLKQLHADSGEISYPQNWSIAHMAQEVQTLDMTALDFVLSGDDEYWLIQQQLKQPNLSSQVLAKLHERFDEIQGYTAVARASQLLAGLGFSNLQFQHLITNFSGGWRMRLNLAKTLMKRSDLLLLDEPTNHLDLDAILWLENWLHNYQGTLILISHDRDFLDAVTSHILHIENLHLTLYTGNYSNFEIIRSERLSQQKQAYEKQQETKKHLEQFINRFKAKATKARQAQSRIKQLERMQFIAPAHIDNPFTFHFRKPSKINSPLLCLEKADIGYPNKLIAKNVNLQITPETRLGLLGINGAGKSTLIKSLVGELNLISGKRKASECLKIGYFTQHQMDSLDNHASPLLQIMRFADSQTSEKTLRSFLGGFGFSGERMDTPCQNFSGGERARLALALIVWQCPNILILDEPTNHLDLDMRHALSMALQDFEGAVILVSHERQLITSVCDDLLLIHDHKVISFDGDLNDYAQWLQQTRYNHLSEQTTKLKSNQSDTSHKKTDKAQRKESAYRRESTAPIRKKIKIAENKIEEIQNALIDIEEKLTNNSLYDADRKDDLLKIMSLQIEYKNQLYNTEEQLLQYMLELEDLENHFKEL